LGLLGNLVVIYRLAEILNYGANPRQLMECYKKAFWQLCQSWVWYYTYCSKQMLITKT